MTSNTENFDKITNIIWKEIMEENPENFTEDFHEQVGIAILKIIDIVEGK